MDKYGRNILVCAENNGRKNGFNIFLNSPAGVNTWLHTATTAPCTTC